jgi:hypothetical protein
MKLLVFKHITTGRGGSQEELLSRDREAMNSNPARVSRVKPRKLKWVVFATSLEFGIFM